MATSKRPGAPCHPVRRRTARTYGATGAEHGGCRRSLRSRGPSTAGSAHCFGDRARGQCPGGDEGAHSERDRRRRCPHRCLGGRRPLRSRGQLPAQQAEPSLGQPGALGHTSGRRPIRLKPRCAVESASGSRRGGGSGLRREPCVIVGVLPDSNQTTPLWVTGVDDPPAPEGALRSNSIGQPETDSGDEEVHGVTPSPPDRLGDLEGHEHDGDEQVAPQDVEAHAAELAPDRRR